MADLNKTFLMGRLTFDPELRHTSGSTAVTELRIVTNRVWYTSDNEKKEDTLFIDVTVWGKQAENACQYLRKGSGVHVEGSLKLDQWEDKKTGEKRSKISVQGERIQYLDAKPKSDQATAPTPAREPRREEPRREQSKPAETARSAMVDAVSDVDDDSIPF